MDAERRGKVLDKIKKCLALGKSSNEHEAAAALRQAQKLMTMHGISDDEVEGVDYVVGTVMTDYEYGKRKPLVVVAVANLIQHAMGLEVVMGGTKNPRGAFVHTVTYVGPRARIHAAVYAHEVVYRAVGRAWRKYSAENPWSKRQQGSRAGFYAGWCNAVRQKVEALVVSDKEAEGIRRAIERHYPSTTPAKVGTRSIDARTADAGAEMAKDFELNKPLGQDRARIGHDH